METDLAVREQGSTALAPVVTEKQLELVQRTVAPNATPDELQLFLYDCARQVWPGLWTIPFESAKGAAAEAAWAAAEAAWAWAWAEAAWAEAAEAAARADQIFNLHVLLCAEAAKDF